MKIEIEKDRAILDFIELFGIGKNNSTRDNDTFWISKEDFSRGEVIDMLEGYFADKCIKGGFVQIKSITFVYTVFNIYSSK